MESIIFLTGAIAAVITTTAFLPQVIKAHKTKHTKDLSLSMYVGLSVGIFLWILYGFLLNSSPIIIANIITFILSLYIVFLKLKYK